MSKDITHRLHMVSLLSAETEKHMLSLKGEVQHRFAFKLNNALTAIESLRKECDHFISRDDVDDMAEIFSKILSEIKSGELDKFLGFCSAYFNGEIQIEA